MKPKLDPKNQHRGCHGHGTSSEKLLFGVELNQGRGYVCRYSQRTVEGAEHSCSGVTGSCESPDVGSRNWTWVPWESSKFVKPLSCLYSFIED